MKSQEELVKYYTRNLKKVESLFKDATTCLQKDKAKGCIRFAKMQLKCVKLGGMPLLIKFWDKYNARTRN